MLTGDDPGARSSSIAHQSEHALIHCGIPVLNPSHVQDYLDLGLMGIALSRYAGCWVGFKCLTDTVDSAASVDVSPGRVEIRTPDFERAEGLHIGWTNIPLQVEQRLYRQRMPAVHAFVRANGLDRVTVDSPQRRFGIVTTGKAYLDVRQALEELGIDEARAAELGISVYKVALTWPLEPEGALEFAGGLEELLVVEEKRPVMEDQLARILYNQERRPLLLGKSDTHGELLVPSEGELAPGDVVRVLRRWLGGRIEGLAAEPEALPVVQSPAASGGLMRLPSFCSGCPHSSSTVVPEESVALGGIGCHGMAVWLPDRRTLAVTQMGGEGANWIGAAPFTGVEHIFQNIGDGTYFHSGLLAIRAAVTAGVNITYKVLANGAVAMTGGQPIEGEPMEGEVTVPEIARQLAAEGVKRIAVVSDAPDKYPRGAGFPPDVTFHHRDAINTVQRELREHGGVSALIYDQTCAAEARRLRKRGAFPDPDERIVINERVCEGCGDCSVQSNCISIEPVETEFGRKRWINQSTCNKDYSCVKGYCPSFVSVKGGTLRKRGAEALDRGGDEPFRDLPEPARAPTDEPWDMLVAGIGGSGVITVGALIGMAAHLEGQGCSVLDVTGLAQKNGPVTSHVRVAENPEALHSTRIAAGRADLVLGCDIVVTSNPENLSRMAARTHAVVNAHVAPTADFAFDPDLDLSPRVMEAAIAAACGDADADFPAATEIATALLGDAIATNLFLVGFAAQRGLLPVGLPALQRAIELNGRAVQMNTRALAWGRLMAHDPEAVRRAAGRDARSTAPAEEPLGALVDRREKDLTAYQSARWARRYRARVDSAAAREHEIVPDSTALARAVANYQYKLMAYKDEYEVARLYTDGTFRAQLESEFEGDYQLEFHLAPPWLPILDRFIDRRHPDTGRTKKIVSRWWEYGFQVLARLRFLRGTPLDLFGHHPHRRLERGLIDDYERVMDEVLAGLKPDNLDLAVQIASLPESVRGFELVKESHLEDVQAKQTELLTAFRLRSGSGEAPSPGAAR